MGTAQDSVAAVDSAPVPCEKHRLLIVDDEEMVRQIFKRLFAMEFPGIVVDLATNGLEAVKLFHASHPSVIVMDLYMPVMDGGKAYREIEQLCAKQKWEMPAVVFCTGYNPSPDIRSVVATNPSHCVLQKPVKNQVLVDAVRSRLNP